jgi:hypothetical protein
MARKPRRFITREELEEILQGIIIDEGTFDGPDGATTGGGVTLKADPDPPPQPGRPPDSTTINYEDMDPLIDFWHLHPGAFTQKTLIDLIRYVYEKYGKSPVSSTIKTRIKRRQPKYK